MSTAPSTALRCEGLTKRYGDLTAVDHLDLEVYAGECFGLLGPNGAGKTTTVEILEGLTPPTRGRVEVFGISWGEGDDGRLRRRIGIQLQQTQLPPKLTVEETVRLFRSFFPSGRSAEEAIAIGALEEKRHARVEKLSGGQAQRLSLACALVGDPEVLFLDEPTTGLDPQARLAIWRVAEEFRERGGTLLMTTHYMEEASRLCDRVAVIDHGKAIALGTPRELIGSLGADQIVELELDGEPLGDDDLADLPAVRAVSRRDGTHVLSVTEVAACLPALLARLAERGAELTQLRTHEATLEDVFVHLTGRELADE